MLDYSHDARRFDPPPCHTRPPSLERQSDRRNPAARLQRRRTRRPALRCCSARHLRSTNSEGFGINSLGEVTGTATLPGDTKFRAFVFRNGTLVDLGMGDNSVGHGINMRGDVTGGGSIRIRRPRGSFAAAQASSSGRCCRAVTAADQRARRRCHSGRRRSLRLPVSGTVRRRCLRGALSELRRCSRRGVRDQRVRRRRRVGGDAVRSLRAFWPIDPALNPARS